jgi:hypothetical protein
MSTSHPHTPSESDSWKNVVQTFVTDILTHVRGNIVEHVQAWGRRLRNRTIGSLLIIIGGLFCIIALTLLINILLASVWLGYALTGLLLIIIGLLITLQ